MEPRRHLPAAVPAVVPQVDVIAVPELDHEGAGSRSGSTRCSSWGARSSATGEYRSLRIV